MKHPSLKGGCRSPARDVSGVISADVLRADVQERFRHIAEVILALFVHAMFCGLIY